MNVHSKNSYFQSVLTRNSILTDKSSHRLSLSFIRRAFLMLFAAALTISSTPVADRSAHAAPASQLPGGLPPGAIGWLLANLDPNELTHVQATFRGVDGEKSGASSYVEACEMAPIEDFVEDRDLYSRRPVVADGFSLVAGTRRNIGGIVRSDWFAEGRSTLAGLGTPSTDLIVPLLLSDFYGQCSALDLRNTSNRPAVVHLAASRGGESLPTWERELTIEPLGAFRLDLCGATLPGLEKFVGSMHIESSVPVAGWITTVVSPRTKAAHAIAVPPISAAASDLFAPLIRSAHDRAYSTGISVVNPNDVPVDVSVTYHGAGGSCAGKTYHHGSGPESIEANSSTLFLQDPRYDSGLPMDCYGSAAIRSDGGGVVAVVIDSMFETASAASYLAFTPSDGAEKILLPLVRQKHFPDLLLTTGIQVMNIGSTRTTVEITNIVQQRKGIAYSGCTKDCTAEIGPGDSHTFMPTNMEGFMESGELGWAIVESDREPLAVIVNEVSYTRKLDAATYSGLPCRTEGPSRVGLP